jgi:hypothetical protein
MGLAAETFNDGLRAYYLSFAVVAWFFSAWAFMGPRCWWSACCTAASSTATCWRRCARGSRRV